MFNGRLSNGSHSVLCWRGPRAAVRRLVLSLHHYLKNARKWPPHFHGKFPATKEDISTSLEYGYGHFLEIMTLENPQKWPFMVKTRLFSMFAWMTPFAEPNLGTTVIHFDFGSVQFSVMRKFAVSARRKFWWRLAMGWVGPIETGCCKI